MPRYVEVDKVERDWPGNGKLIKGSLRLTRQLGEPLGSGQSCAQGCPSSKMGLTTKVRVSNGSGGSVSGDPQIEICGMQQGVTSLLRPSRGSLYAS